MYVFICPDGMFELRYRPPGIKTVYQRVCWTMKVESYEGLEFLGIL